MQEITNIETYEEVINKDSITVIKFYTDWCPDCTRFDQYIGDIIAKHSDKAWYAMDRDKFEELGEKESVLGIPSLLVFKNGEKIGHLRADRKSPEEVEAFVNQFA